MSRIVLRWVIVHSVIGLIAHLYIGDISTQIPLPPVHNVFGFSFFTTLLEVFFLHYLVTTTTLPLSQAILLPEISIWRRFALLLTTIIASVIGFAAGTAGFFFLIFGFLFPFFSMPAISRLDSSMQEILFQLFVLIFFVIRASLPILLSSILQSSFLGYPFRSKRNWSWIRIQQVTNLIVTLGTALSIFLILTSFGLFGSVPEDYIVGAIFAIFLGPVTGWILGRYWARNANPTSEQLEPIM